MTGEDTTPSGDAAAMTLERFEALADLHGGALGAWPEADQAAAAALIARSPAAATILREADALDAALTSAARDTRAESAAVPARLSARLRADAAAFAADRGAQAATAERELKADKPQGESWLARLRRRVETIGAALSNELGPVGGGAIAAAAALGLLIGVAAPDPAEAGDDGFAEIAYSIDEENGGAWEIDG